MTLGGWGLANPMGLLWGLLALPIIALHILRPRRVQAAVSAVFLWRKVDLPVTAATPWQRLIPSWLLAAQVLAALLLALLAARPVQLTDLPLADHTVFVIDASASMRATDGAPDRLASAIDRAEELRRQVPEGGEASLIVAGPRARALLSHSSDRSAFDEALGQIRAGDGAADFAGAFALASGLDTGELLSRVVLISDGGVSDADLRLAPVGARYERVGSSATNRGITQLSVEPAEGGLLARATVVHFGGPSATQELRIDVDGVTATRTTVELEPGGVVNVALPIPSGEMVEAFLEGEDALSIDNRAVATVSRRPELDVLWIGADDPFIGAALAANPGLSIERAATYPTSLDPAIDVVVVAGVSIPADAAPIPLVAIAPPGGARGVEANGTVARPILSLIRSDIPLVQDLDLSQVGIAESQRLTTPVDADVVLGAEGAPLLVLVDGADGKMAYLAFDLDQSTLPLQAAFPVLFDRLLGDVAERVSPPPRLTVGADLPIDPQLAATITAPSGTSEQIPPGSSYPAADAVGFWRVEQSGRPAVTIAVGIERAESVIAPVPDLPFEAAFEGTALADEKGELPWRTIPTLVVLAVIAAELLLARRRRGVAERQWQVALALRGVVAAALVMSLLSPVITRSTDRVATMFLIDASDSMGSAGSARAVGFVREALVAQPEGDLAGVVVFGGDARLEQLVRNESSFANLSVRVDPSGTDLSAALRLGAAALPDDARKRLVLISDGRATTGDVDDEIARLADEQIPVDVVVIDSTIGNDLAVAGVDAPSLVRDGEQVSVDVRIVAPTAGAAVVTLSRDGEAIETRTVELEAGENTLRFTDVATDQGVLRYQATIDAVGDSVAANDIGYAAVPVAGAERVLVVEGRDDAGAALVAALDAAGVAADVVTPGRVPALDELTRYASIVLADVDRRDLSDGQIEALTAAVRDLGRGMLVVGGTHSYALGGYRGSPLEDILPVVSEITDPLRRQTVAEVLAIDSSGSMGACHCNEEGQNGMGGGNRIDGGVSKTAIARNAAARAIAALEATDEVGVLSMDANDSWLIDLQASPAQEDIDSGLNQIVPDGPTFLDTGLLTAADALRASDASLKHIIFFSDGFTDPGDLAFIRDQAAELYAEGITVSVVATGEGAAADLRPIADAGGGRFYPGTNLEEIPELIVQEAVIASRDFVNEGEFLPIISSSASTVRSLTESPTLLGYIATTAKPTARVDLRIGPDEDPLLASWQAGLGRVAAWTSDGGERWSMPWSAWSGAPDFWAGVVKDTFPVVGDGGGIVAKVVDGQLELRLEGTQDWPADGAGERERCRPRRQLDGRPARAHRRLDLRRNGAGRRRRHLRHRGDGDRRRRHHVVGDRADHPLLPGGVCASTDGSSPARAHGDADRRADRPDHRRRLCAGRHPCRSPPNRSGTVAPALRSAGLADRRCRQPTGLAARHAWRWGPTGRPRRSRNCETGSPRWPNHADRMLARRSAGISRPPRRRAPLRWRPHHGGRRPQRARPHLPLGRPRRPFPARRPTVIRRSTSCSLESVDATDP